MHKSVRVSCEKKRGCGYRKTGGKYLVGGVETAECGRMPIPLNICPVCSAGLKPSRGWTWVDADRLIHACKEGEPCHAPLAECALCIIERILRAGLVGKSVIGQAGLIWVGERFYPTVGDFKAEALDMGISRRIASVPREFILGETYVLLAHRKAVIEYPQENDGSIGKPEFSPGIFWIWKPEAIEVIVDEEISEEKIESYQKRGWTPVQVARMEEEGVIETVVMGDVLDPQTRWPKEYLAGLDKEDVVE